MAIVITGTPGTGKTTCAKALGKELELPIVNITELMEEQGLDEEWDSKRNCFLVDVIKLTELLEKIISHNKDVIIEGHLAHYLDPEHVDRCIVTKCDIKVLKERLESRGYSEDKVRENLDCEIFDVCYQEAIERGYDPEIIDTSTLINS